LKEAEAQFHFKMPTPIKEVKGVLSFDDPLSG
jgi:hypothetical protein